MIPKIELYHGVKVVHPKYGEGAICYLYHMNPKTVTLELDVPYEHSTYDQLMGCGV